MNSKYQQSSDRKCYRIRRPNIPEPTYELVTKLTSDDVNMEKNPSYSVADAQDSSSDHHYDVIPANDDAKDKKK